MSAQIWLFEHHGRIQSNIYIPFHFPKIHQTFGWLERICRPRAVVPEILRR